MAGFKLVMNSLIDIITVTKDDFEGVCRSIQSTSELRERHGLRQIIVDSSSEGIKEKIKDSIRREKNIDYIWEEPQGISSAFNAGLAHSSAEWTWFLNGGDEVHKDINVAAFLYIMNASKADIIMFELEFMQSGTRYQHAPLYAMGPLVLCKNWVPHPATLVRRRLFDRYGKFDTQYKIAMDCEMWIRFLSDKNISLDLISIPIVSFDENGISATQRCVVAREMKKLMITNFWKFTKMWLTTGRWLLSAFKQYHRESKTRCEN